MTSPLRSLVVALVALGISQAGATEITIPDFNPGAGFGSNPAAGIAGEDNETEPGTVPGQNWDMEAFVIDSGKLFLVGGYDINSGVTHGGYNYRSGDIFIKIGSPASPLPLTPGSGDVANGTYQNYDYAIDLSAVGMGIGAGSTTVYDLNASSMLNTAIWDQFRSNPWKFVNGSSTDDSEVIAINYTEGHASGSAALVALGLGHLTGGLHNILEIDLGFLTGTVPSGTQVYFSYTMECGNDSIKGQYGGGFDRVPDDSTSALLIGLGLATVTALGLRRRRAA